MKKVLPASPAVMSDLIKKETDRRAASSSLYEFVKQAWHVVEPGIPFIGGWHIEEICEHFGIEDSSQSGEIYIRRFKDLTKEEETKWFNLSPNVLVLW